MCLPRSSDLTPADYLWSHLKDTVYGKRANKLDEFWFLVELTAAVRHVPECIIHSGIIGVTLFSYAFRLREIIFSIWSTYFYGHQHTIFFISDKSPK
jgi:hypothetical protein